MVILVLQVQFGASLTTKTVLFQLLIYSETEVLHGNFLIYFNGILINELMIFRTKGSDMIRTVKRTGNAPSE
jgi:hypothetical protein